MPADEPKGHHYVQRAYLEGFVDSTTVSGDQGKLWLYLAGKKPFAQRPERVAKRNYYYCYEKGKEKQFDIEQGLQKLEDVSLPILKKLRVRDFELSKQDKLTFAGYVALSFTRVPKFERTANFMAALVSASQLESASRDQQMLEEMARLHREETGEDKSPDQMQKALTGGTVVATQDSRKWSLGQMVKIMFHLQKLIVKMHWTFFVASSDDPGFLTSDNPVVLFDPSGGLFGGIGFASSPDAYFTFPICQEVCLLGGYKAMQSVIESSSVDIRRVNSGTIDRSDKQVYAPFKSDKIQSIMDRI